MGIYFVVMVFGVVGIGIGVVILDNEEVGGVVPFIIGMALLVLAGYAAFDAGEAAGYRQGQIDALSGQRVAWVLQPQADGSVAWAERKDVAE